jgi:hypothetical protein
MKAIRAFGVLSLLLCLAAAIALAVLAMRKSARQSFTLADGTIIRIEAVTYGKSHQFSMEKPWQAWVRAHLSFAARLLPTGNTVVSSTTTQNDAMVFWIRRFDPQTGKHLPPKWGGVDVEDRDGCKFRIRGWGSSGNHISHFVAEAFPRREAGFWIHVHMDDEQMAQFEVENPVRGPFPKWVTEELPATHSDGDLLITLNRLRYRGGSDSPNVSTEFTVRQNGEPTKEWDDKSVRLSDATGNVGWSFLCTNEPAWQISANFYRTAAASFDEKEIWRLPKMRAPTNGEGITFNQSTSLNGAQLTLLAFAGAGTYTISNGVFLSSSATIAGNQWSISSGSDKAGSYNVVRVAQKTPLLLVQANGLTGDDRLLIRAKDAKGKIIAAEDHGSANDMHTFQFGKAIPAEELDLEFIINKPRHAEFIVKPPTAEPKTPRR